MKLYQLEAQGGCLGSRRDVRTSTVYRTREAAFARIEQVREIVTNLDQVFPLDKDSIRIRIIELEVVD